MPTHSRRADLRLQGLVVDDLPFDKRWNAEDLLLHVMEQLPTTLSAHRVQFLKASYGSLTPVNLPDGAALSCDRLLRIVGQASIYVQVVPREPSSGSSTTTHKEEEREEEDGIVENIAVSSETIGAMQNARDPTSLTLASYSSPAIEVHESTSAASEQTDVLTALTAIFPNRPERALRECASHSDSVESAVAAMLDRDQPIDSIMEELQERVDRAHPVPITVRRENVWRDSLAFYKIAMVEKNKLFRELKVEFAGEDGVDCGALKVEYFRICIEAALNSLFEDVDDSKIPKKTSASLLAYKVFGMLAAHSLLQGGPGLHCLPEWCYHFLATGDFQATAELLFSEGQVPLNAATALFHALVKAIRNSDMPDKIYALLDETTPTGQVYAQIVNSSSWDMTEIISVEKRDALI